MVSMVKISRKIYKICFIPYSTTLSIKNVTEKKPKAVKDREGVGVGLTAVKD